MIRVSDIKSCAASRVLFSLTQNGDMTYAELEDNTGLSNKSVRSAISELRLLGFTQVYPSGNGRILMVKATLTTAPIDTSISTMSKTADETGNVDKQVAAMRVALEEVIPTGSYTGKSPTDRNYRTWLARIGTSEAFYDLLQEAIGKPVKSPIPYVNSMITNELKAVASDNARSKPEKPHYEDEGITNYDRATALWGMANFADNEEDRRKYTAQYQEFIAAHADEFDTVTP
jgi:hypothetical protein